MKCKLRCILEEGGIGCSSLFLSCGFAKEGAVPPKYENAPAGGPLAAVGVGEVIDGLGSVIYMEINYRRF